MTSIIAIKVAPRRMLTVREAADYCGVQAKDFKGAFPYMPIKMPNGVKLYDINDLDKWIDELKTGHNRVDDRELIERLGR